MDAQIPSISSFDVWMTSKEAATYARTTTGTLSTLRSKQAGPKYYKPSARRVLYKKSDVDAWIENQSGGCRG